LLFGGSIFFVKELSMKRSSPVTLSLCLSMLFATGCTRSKSDAQFPSGATMVASATAPANDHDAVVAAIQKHLTSDSGINMSVMNMSVGNVTINGDQAQADTTFRLKQGGTSMDITYKLERHAGEWIVLSDSPNGGQFTHPPMDKNHSGSAAVPNSAQQLPDATAFLKNHAAPTTKSQ
jgi:hypothetical protein